MNSQQVRQMWEAAQSEAKGVNTGFRALASHQAVSELCSTWLLLREALKDIENVCLELDMPSKDRVEYIKRLTRTALESTKTAQA